MACKKCGRTVLKCECDDSGDSEIAALRAQLAAFQAGNDNARSAIAIWEQTTQELRAQLAARDARVRELEMRNTELRVLLDDSVPLSNFAERDAEVGRLREAIQEAGRDYWGGRVRGSEIMIKLRAALKGEG